MHVFIPYRVLFVVNDKLCPTCNCFETVPAFNIMNNIDGAHDFIPTDVHSTHCQFNERRRTLVIL